MDFLFILPCSVWSKRCHKAILQIREQLLHCHENFGDKHKKETKIFGFSQETNDPEWYTVESTGSPTQASATFPAIPAVSASERPFD